MVPWPNCPGVAPAQQDRRAKSEANRVKDVRIASCKFVFTTFFTTNSLHVIHPRRLRLPVTVKVPAQETPNREGATPLFPLSAAPKSSWGRSRPIRRPWRFCADQRVQLSRSWRRVRNDAVKWTSPLYFTFATSPTTSLSVDRRLSEITQMTISKERLCAGEPPPQPEGIAACVRPRKRALSSRSYAAPHTTCQPRLHAERRRVLATLKGTT